MAKTAKRIKSGVWLNMKEPELFGRLREAFEGRNLPPTSLSYMVRIALEEWIEARKK